MKKKVIVDVDFGLDVTQRTWTYKFYRIYYGILLRVVNVCLRILAEDKYNRYKK